jgi:hypothetical protein
MKKHFLFTIFCLIPFLAFSQKKSIDGFLDISFGSDSATVKTAITAKGGTRIDSLCLKDRLAFTGFNMSDRKVYILYVHFVDNKAYEAYFIFNDFNDSEALDYYDRFSADITAVYGKGNITSTFGNENNSVRIKKLELGNASCQTDWQSKNKNLVLLGFSNFNRSISIYLDYQSTDLLNQANAKKRSDL